MQGLVFDIKRFAIHDGDGIRTTVFFKGCPLRCLWCQNPEGLIYEQRLWYFPNRCLHCNQCVESCPEQALSSTNDPHRIHIDHEKCTRCGVCTQICPTNALAFDSNWYSVEALVEEVRKDSVFYDVSGGGVTVSGGDPVYQHEFVTAFLKRCKEEGLHTTLESSMYTSKEIVNTFLPVVYKFIVDLKIFDPLEHKKATGKDNIRIKENIAYLIEQGVDVLIRVPLIPGYTACKENLEQIGKFIHDLSPNTPIELLNHNHLARDKYMKMGLDYPVFETIGQYSTEEMNIFNSYIEHG
jgi:pyruvate formate lyase activating enzyme